jgi:phosphoribosylanthranilate isomerase
MPVRVKICGITNLGDARAAVEAGADALGFIFFKGTPRYVTPTAAREIIRELPLAILKVGVFVNEPLEELQRIALETGINAIQLHGQETPEFCANLARFEVIKALRVKDQSTLAELPKYPVSAFLLDSYVPGQLGGTGEKFNWDLAVRAKLLAERIILAGGLTVENIAAAVAQVAPYGVDVSSGVETSPGRKDHAKVRAFIARARSV